MSMHILIGLGNPGQKYAGTRHNLGFMAIDSIAESSIWKSECRAVTQKTHIAGKDVLLAKPQTYMNLSGESVQALMAFYKVKPENLLVFSDDVNLACGKMRIRPNGSAGGQNGLKSIIEHIGQNFARVRIGAGLVPEQWDLVNWVLSPISKEDRPLCEEAISKVKSLCEVYLTKGIVAAQNGFN
ncbi:MAG: aminoacyl-tRNA hydrolase [Fibromonadales bacterium]|nr:aminoacyl-tRNA hydrolase [Fibromonadales bacterium]